MLNGEAGRRVQPGMFFETSGLRRVTGSELWEKAAKGHFHINLHAQNGLAFRAQNGPAFRAQNGLAFRARNGLAFRVSIHFLNERHYGEPVLGTECAPILGTECETILGTECELVF